MKRKFLFSIYILLGIINLKAQNMMPVVVNPNATMVSSPNNPSVTNTAVDAGIDTGGDSTNDDIQSMTIAVAPEPVRNIYFVHGLGGDRTSWSRVNAFVNSKYKARSYKTVYDEMGDVKECANDLYIHEIQRTNQVNALSPTFIDKSQSIIIAHSQGGIVSRGMDTYEAPGEFGGIATFGTPHNGAYILNNKQEAYSVAARAVADLGEGPIAEGVNNAVPNGWFFNTIFGNTVISTMQGVVNLTFTLGNDILPGFIESFDKTNVPLSDEFKVGAPALTGLTGNSNTKKVCFYGIEEDPILWREIYHYKGKSPNAYPLWEANDDTPYITAANTTMSNYYSKAANYQRLADNTSAFWNPKKKARFQLLASSFLRGASAIGRLNDQFKVIIGATRATSTSTGKKICTCTEKIDKHQVYVTSGPCPTQSPPGETCVESDVYTSTLIEEGSDATVPVSSASAYPNAQHYGSMPKSNHQQLRNDKNTEIAIKGLLKGAFGKFFETPTY